VFVIVDEFVNTDVDNVLCLIDKAGRLQCRCKDWPDGDRTQRISEVSFSGAPLLSGV